MYPNLELEMFKQKINTKQLADVCDISESAMRNKLKLNSRLNELTQQANPPFCFTLILNTFSRWTPSRRRGNEMYSSD